MDSCELYLHPTAGTKLKSRQLQAIASKSEIFGISDVVEKKKKKLLGGLNGVLQYHIGYFCFIT